MALKKSYRRGSIMEGGYLLPGAKRLRFRRSPVVQAGLGLLLGVGVLKTFIKDVTANAKMDQTITKLAPYQGTLGLVSIGLGVWGVVVGFVF